jgi:hypothetical protein
MIERSALANNCRDDMLIYRMMYATFATLCLHLPISRQRGLLTLVIDCADIMQFCHKVLLQTTCYITKHCYVAVTSVAHLSLPHDEEVDAVARRHKALRVQHERLIHTSLVGLLGDPQKAAAAAVMFK